MIFINLLIGEKLIEISFSNFCLKLAAGQHATSHPCKYYCTLHRQHKELNKTDDKEAIFFELIRRANINVNDLNVQNQH